MAWDKTKPAGTTSLRDSDDEIRANFAAIEEAGVPFDGLKLSTQVSTDPTNVADFGFVYVKDVTSKTELHWIDEDGNILQITDAGEFADYEAGSWTPVAAGSGTAGSTSYSNQVGRYTKIGNLVTAHCRVFTSATHNGTSNLNITGLPFTASNISDLNYEGSCSFSGYNFDAPGVYIHSQISSNTSVMHFVQVGDDAAQNQVDIDQTTSWLVEATITYQTDS